MEKMPNLVLRNADFRKVWLGQVLSQGGSKAYLINLLWWVINRADASAESAAVASGALLILAALPSILLVKIIGRVLSKLPSKRVLVTAELCGAALITGVLALLHFEALTLPLLYAITALIAVCQAFVDPTLTKCVGELVDPDDVEGAVAFEASTQSLAYFMGTAVGATLTGLLGLKAAVVLNIVSYGLSATLTALARFKPLEPSTEGGPAAAAFDFASLPGVMRLLYTFAAANFLLFPLFLVLPLFTKDTLQASVVTLGVMEACFWLGLISGAAFSRLFSEESGLSALVGKLLALFGAALGSVVLLPYAWWTGAVLFVGGATAGIVNVKVVTFFQKAVPDHAKGDFFARLQAFVTAAQPLGYLVFTMVLAKVPALVAFGIDGAGLFLVGLSAFRRSEA